MTESGERGMDFRENTTALAQMPDRSDWRDRAVCRDLDPAEKELLFFPKTSHPRDSEKAKSICLRCPVLGECRADCDAIERNQSVSLWEGVWGGESVADRRLRRRATRLTEAVAEVPKPQKGWMTRGGWAPGRDRA